MGFAALVLCNLWKLCHCGVTYRLPRQRLLLGYMPDWKGLLCCRRLVKFGARIRRCIRAVFSVKRTCIDRGHVTQCMDAAADGLMIWRRRNVFGSRLTEHPLASLAAAVRRTVHFSFSSAAATMSRPTCWRSGVLYSLVYTHLDPNLKFCISEVLSKGWQRALW